MSPSKPVKDCHDKILIITGEDVRHQYFVNRLNGRFPLSAVLLETSVYPEPIAHSGEEKNAWDWFFTRRKIFEDKAFGPENRIQTANNPPTIQIPQGKLNAPETVQIIKNFHPEFIALFGTGLLEQEILDLYPNRIFNLHVGLPRFYRGSSCNFWPVHNGHLEKLGASIHLTNAGIDTGNIAAQSVIKLEDDDDEQTLAGKTLTTGIELMISVIQNWCDGTLKLTNSDKTGKLYLRKDFTPEAVLHVRRMVESGNLKRQLIRIREKTRSTQEDDYLPDG
jgi:folate-dependent phosphoribosylglycinamide formyltransferase PurN